ncbi:sensor histidine kinase [Zhihengliuella halotolerans]|uniref:histidine kinase n=1 Tax=Zhihengliuella halotolerans TaxID=370736 RepID=A0A4Q8AGF2_9MICC|nr:histidine kinase [Zhihengliuella halotolerans]RZU63457.1 histidine kinase [Zhihengliuella halotolerans]
MLTWIRRPGWRIAMTVAVALVIGGVLSLVFWGMLLPEDPDALPAAESGRLFLLFAVDVLAGLTALGLLALALLPLDDESPRPHPMTALVPGLIVVAASAVSTMASPAALIVVGSFAARRPRLWFPLAAALCFAAGWFYTFVVDPSTETLRFWEFAAIMAAVLGITGLIGWGRRSRRSLIRSLRQEAVSARREREAHAERARAAERTRIAREMHDGLAHQLSLISLHAGALEYRRDLDAETIRRTSDVIQQTARSASQELRSVLTVLREQDAGTTPQPTLAAIGELVSAARSAGTPVELTDDDGLAGASAHQPSDVTIRALYRIVQECLTNARKHAPGQPVRLTLAGGPAHGIRVSAGNGVAAARAGGADPGFGLIGLRERVELLGGRLHVDCSGDRFTVDAELPWLK